ncbi:unnamed protein product [Adineta ricciae]|uniref:Uncharacterized protein n=1 Tax=Adineta ricciae TaxID=249248 RepID=A0A813NL32_ADIRI|nr:unnamed protein product [Adineta ricciae]CAF1620027.1 unnamed protein product [Adineta ricciae]
MQFYSIVVFLALTVFLVSSKSIRPVDSEHDESGEDVETYRVNQKYNPSYNAEQRLLAFLKNKVNQIDDDQYDVIAKRSRLITKGDPREFMG